MKHTSFLFKLLTFFVAVGISILPQQWRHQSLNRFLWNFNAINRTWEFKVSKSHQNQTHSNQDISRKSGTDKQTTRQTDKYTDRQTETDRQTDTVRRSQCFPDCKDKCLFVLSWHYYFALACLSISMYRINWVDLSTVVWQFRFAPVYESMSQCLTGVMYTCRSSSCLL